MARPLGSPNVLTREIRHRIEEALRILNTPSEQPQAVKGVLQGLPYLTWLALEEPRIFGALLARSLPLPVRAEIEVSTVPSIRILDYTGRSGDVVREIPAAVPESPDGQASPEMLDLEPSQQDSTTNGVEK